MHAKDSGASPFPCDPGVLYSDTGTDGKILHHHHAVRGLTGDVRMERGGWGLALPGMQVKGVWVHLMLVGERLNIWRALWASM